MAAATCELNSQLDDWLTEFVVLADDPELRAARVCAIVRTVTEALEWRGGWEPSVELASAAQLLQAAREHQHRMTAPAPG